MNRTPSSFTYSVHRTPSQYRCSWRPMGSSKKPGWRGEKPDSRRRPPCLGTPIARTLLSDVAFVVTVSESTSDSRATSDGGATSGIGFRRRRRSARAARVTPELRRVVRRSITSAIDEVAREMLRCGPARNSRGVVRAGLARRWRCRAAKETMTRAAAAPARSTAATTSASQSTKANSANMRSGSPRPRGPARSPIERKFTAFHTVRGISGSCCRHASSCCNIHFFCHRTWDDRASRCARFARKILIGSGIRGVAQKS